MKLAKIIAAFRRATDDKAAGQQFSDEDITAWLAEAEAEAAMRKLLLHEALDPTMCEIVVARGVQSYKLHPRWFAITHAWIQDDGCSDWRRRGLVLRSREALDAWRHDWRTDCTQQPYAINSKGGTLTVAGYIERPGRLHLEGYRLPKRPLDDECDTSPDDREPEIHEIHHRHLIDWALWRGYSVPDAEVLNETEAAAALRRFELYFGLRVDGDLLTDQLNDVHHHNQAWY